MLRIAILCLLFAACSTPTVQPSQEESVQVQSFPEEDTLTTPEQEDATALYYVVAVATGKNYDSLWRVAQDAASWLSIPYDSLGRYYHPEKGIVLPDSCEDELYCGEYFPRRPFEGEPFISIERLDAFPDTSRQETMGTEDMVVIAGLFAEKAEAEDQSSVLKKRFALVRVYPSWQYLGCMH